MDSPLTLSLRESCRNARTQLSPRPTIDAALSQPEIEGFSPRQLAARLGVTAAAAFDIAPPSHVTVQITESAANGPSPQT
ncbi:MAG: hypothetical protein ACK5PF_01855, partial [bacterium]